ncbi:50S ribosomal protein L3 [Candidatus Woesearchaeota archaeon]|nr:50S ribosomal protein L3 [Candidatus Woesearchaeota archaeon]
MGRIHHPRLGSMQFWPRKRSRHSLVRVRSWPANSKVKPLAFIGFKAGMTHVMAVDNYGKSMTKNETVALPVTIIECPPMKVAGIAFYKQDLWGIQKCGTLLTEKPEKELSRKFPLPIKNHGQIPAQFDDLRLLVQSQPKLTSVGTKKPKLIEIALGGNKDEKLRYAQEMVGKELQVEEVLQGYNLVDVKGVTRGKGYQGTVKRFGAHLRQHKAEKTKRGIATLGSWHPNRILFTVPQGGKMGYHFRTEYNKQILKISKNPAEVNKTGGNTHYGQIKNPYVLVKGSIVGPQKRALVLTQPMRPDQFIPKEMPEIQYISQS